MDSAQSARPAKMMIFSRDENPLGSTWENWTIEWWRWILSINKDENPGQDSTGEKFNAKKRAGDVIFLVGTFDGESAERHYTIESGKAVLFPVINFITSYAEDQSIKEDTDLFIRANEDIEKISNKIVEIDGIRVPEIEKYRVQSQVFAIGLQDNNILGVSSGQTKAISDGYWIFLRALQSGEHRICASGACMAGTTSENIIWNLTVG